MTSPSRGDERVSPPRDTAAWKREVYEPAVQRHPERREHFTTSSGFEHPPVYTPEDAALPAPEDYPERLGWPGAFPFTRGVQPTMYRGRLWTMRQYAGFQSAEASNRRYHYLLSRGQTGLSVAFDLPTQIGYDSDHPLSRGEVGKVGVPISCLHDMEVLLDGIPLEDVSISMTINATAIVLLALLIAVARRRGVDPARLRGTLQNDILKEYVARGTYRFPPGPSMRLVVDTFAYTAEHMPRWNPISISGYHIREAGSTAVQELAFTFAHAIAYVEAALAAGLEIDRFAPRLSFFWNAHNDLLEEVAKFRAARRIWARLVRDRFGARDPRSMRLRFHAQTAGSTLTSQQYENNVVRVTIQALAAVLGGCQSLHTNSRDEAIGLPTEDAVRIALRTQQIIAYESGVSGTADPFGGSYAVEALTDRIEAEVQRYLERIEAMGGTLAAIEAGFPQREIHEAAFAYQQALEKGEAIVVGVNAFREEDEPPPGEILEIDPAVEAERRELLAGIRARRDAQAAEQALAALREAAAGDANLVPYVVQCVERDVTLGEVCAALASVFGEHEDDEHY
ncbi:MAG: methylmalonyl-CoA mutase [Planctomycetota bacterium]|nr:MAG: methylmalonyl-CoA mutase [Planctomycetota bacterium]